MKRKLDQLQKSYSEAFSMHALTRIIYSGWKERMIWCVLFLAAVTGLGYMSREIIEHFYHKDVRTEVRIEQRESQQWPAIIICSKAVLAQILNCYQDVNTTDLPPGFCSRQLRLPKVTENTENQTFHNKQGCMVYNIDEATLMHVGGLKMGLDIHYEDYNTDLPSYLKGIYVYFHDAETVKNSSSMISLSDFGIGNFGVLLPGVHEIMLEKTEIEKLGPPYKSLCTHQKNIADRHNSKYTYAFCIDKCVTMKTWKKCGDVPKVSQDYITDVHKNTAKDRNETIQCFQELLIAYMYDKTFLNDCECKQSCEQKLYDVTQRQVEQYEESKWFLKIRFKSKMVNIIKEHPLYGTEELISQVGGSCGLFLGMSLLSLVEIVFYVVISLARHFFRD